MIRVSIGLRYFLISPRRTKMWAADKKNKIRHMVGMSKYGNPITLCGKKMRAPFNYLRFDLPKCAKCEKEMGRKR